jgi:hypothetical protein
VFGLRSHLTLLLLLIPLALLLLRGPGARLLLLYCPVRSLQCRRSFYIAIGCKRLVDSYIGWAAMVRVCELGAVGAGGSLILHLSTHGRGVRLAHRHQLRRPGRRPDAT